MLAALFQALPAVPARIGAVARLASGDPAMWYVTRAAAISAYVLLALTVLVGLLRSMLRSSGWRAPGLVWLLDEAHQYIAALAAVFVGLHLVTLLLDPVVPFTLVNLIVPLGEPYRPAATSLGVFSLYTLGAVLLSSWMRRSLSYGFWRALHFASFLAFVLVTLHGILAGADTGEPWMSALYASSAGVVALLVGLRMLIAAFRAPSGQFSAR
jgi:sulfoxide reductase heme-binding subunit YedZ